MHSGAMGSAVRRSGHVVTATHHPATLRPD